MHVHVATPDGTAKFWLEPIIALADFYNLPSRELREVQLLVEEHEDEFRSAWRQHFLQ
jgi:hypothetical protein